MFKYLDHSSPNMRTESPSRRRLKYQNMESLFDDLSSLTETPELCDVKFVVGKNKTPVYGVKSIISTRNRILYSIIIAQEKADIREKKMQNRNQSLSRKVQRMFSRIVRGDKKQTANQRPQHLLVALTEFDPDIFRRILDHVMSGTVTVDVNCVIAVMEAAAQFEIEDLREACYQFAQRHISLDNALQLLDCCELGWQSKWARCIKDQVLKFIAQNWKTIGRQEGLRTSSSKAFQAILATPGLRGPETSVSEALLRWERHHGRNLFLSESCATTGNDSGVPDCGQSTDSDFRISIDDLINQAELLQAASMAMGGNRNFCQESAAAHRCGQKSLSDTEAKSAGLGKFSKRHLMSASQNYISCMDNAFVCSSLDISSLVS